MPAKKLTDDPLEVPRYKEFAHMIAMGHSQREAIKQTGTGNNTAVKLMRDSKVLGYIQEIRAEVEHELKITRQDALKGYTRAIRQADIQGDPKTQIAGWDSICRLEGLNAPEKHEHHHSGEIKHMQEDLRAKSDSELEKILEQNGNDIVDGEFEECQAADGTT